MASIRATVKAYGKQREKRFPAGSSKRAIQDWKDRTRGRLKDDAPSATPGTFAADADRYLPTLIDRYHLHKERTRQLEWWIRRLGPITRAEITPDRIRAELADLRLTKAASTCNHYRMALSHLWTTLDGKQARNPLRDVPTFPEPESEPRDLPHDLIGKILDAFAPWGRAVKDQKRSRVSLAAIRLRVIWRTGLSPAELMRVRPADLRLNDRAVYVRRRLKGKGVDGMLMPLTPDGVAAFQAFADANAFGPFSTHAVYRCWIKACRKLREHPDTDAETAARLRRARPYDLRHTFGTMILQQTGNLATTKELMRHRSTKTTKRYARAAVAPHLRAAIDSLSAGASQPPTL